jgi:hypothetical protein
VDGISTKWCILRLRPRSDEPCNDQGFTNSLSRKATC